MKFKIGDRVRIVGVVFCSNAENIGKEGTVVGRFGKYRNCSFRGYQVEIDNRPSPMPPLPWVCAPEHLEPLIGPDEQAWEAFRSLHLKPDPALILAKEPA